MLQMRCVSGDLGSVSNAWVVVRNVSRNLALNFEGVESREVKYVRNSRMVGKRGVYFR